MDELSEAVNEVKLGNESAFNKIVLATNVRLVRVAARIMGSLEDGEDVVQEAYVKAHRALVEGRFDGRSRVDTWLYRVVTNTAIDALRSGKKRLREADVAAEPAWDGREAAEARVALAELDTLLSTLPPDQRAALVLKSVEGMSANEVAEVMGTTEGAVEQHLVRARAALRRWSKSDA